LSEKQAKEIAAGGSIVLMSSITDRALRLGVTLLLSGFFGPEIFGIYTLTITIVTLVKMFSPLGTELGTIYFGARFRQDNEQAKMKGLVISSLGISTFSAIVCSIILWLAAPTIVEINPELRLSEFRWAIPAILFWTPLHTLVGLLRAQKDMKGNAIVYEIAVPLLLLAGAIAIVLLNLSLQTALIAYWFSLALSLSLGIKWSWGHFGSILQNRSIKPVYFTKELLKYSIPMAFSQFVFRLNAWMDIIMLGWLASSADVGIYKIAVSLAMVCSLPIHAIITIFNPIIVELVNKKDFTKLNGLLKLVTKWLLLFNLPVLMIFFVIPDIVLLFFGKAYQPSQGPLEVLVMGQLVWSACSIAMRLIPMSGYPLLNLVNGIVAGLVNIGLNYILIPKYGSIGAAIATASTLAVWSMWRLVEARYLLRCFPFHKISFLMISSAVTISLGLKYVLEDQSPWLRILSVGLSIVVFIAASVIFGREKEDQVILQTIKQKLNRFTKD
jgi:O-antigen/teichoic acid export membrane protein